MTEQEEKMWAEDLKMISKLNVEVDVLQQRIDKAIEYVKEHRYYAHTIDIDELLEILKGGNNE